LQPDSLGRASFCFFYEAGCYRSAEAGRAAQISPGDGPAVLKNDIYRIENDIGGGINNHLAWHKILQSG